MTALMKNIKSIIAAILLLTCMSANAGEKKTEGFEYFLPKTAVRMSVLVEKTTTKPGNSLSSLNSTSRRRALPHSRTTIAS